MAANTEAEEVEARTEAASIALPVLFHTARIVTNPSTAMCHMRICASSCILFEELRKHYFNKQLLNIFLKTQFQLYIVLLKYL